jgi:glycosyltransferase involved in cell wall biosynthesis
MSSTRNLGLAAAHGELVAFLDADDVWEPGHLTHEVGLLMAHPEAGVVCGQAIDWYSWADSGARDIASPLPWPAGVVVAPPDMLVALLRRGAFRTPVCNLLVRKQVLESVGGSEDEFAGLFEDQALLAKLYLSHRIVISGARTARYRRHAESSTARAERDHRYDPSRPNLSMAAFLRWLSSLLQDGQVDEEVLTLLRAARRPVRDAAPSRFARSHCRLRGAQFPHRDGDWHGAPLGGPVRWDRSGWARCGGPRR